MTERVAGNAGLRMAAACVLAMVCGPPAVAADVQPCALVDHEDWQREHRPPAGKVASELNAGEPRTVRMFYFLPNDRPYRQSVVDTMKARMVRMQTLFAVQMAAHGYGYMTFRYEADADGGPVVHRVDGEHDEAYYFQSTRSRMFSEIVEAYQRTDQVSFVVIDYSSSWLYDHHGNVYAIGSAGGSKDGGSTLAPADYSWQTGIHELAHAFGMTWHDFRDDSYILSYGRHTTRLSACAAAVLSLSPFFNAEISLETGREWGPTVEHASETPWYPAGSERVSVPMRVADPDGVVLVLFQVGNHLSSNLAPENKACRALSGETDAEVTFEYDGVIPGASRAHPSLSNPATHFLTVQAFDAEGDVGWLNFSIAQRSPYHLATLEATCEDRIKPVAFSPDGRLLAAGSRHQGTEVDPVLSVWDVAKRREIAAWVPHRNDVLSLAFSPDGKVLASGSAAFGYRDQSIKLWDVATLQKIASLDKLNLAASSLAFSPDGTILAAGTSAQYLGDGSWLDAIILWDVATLEEIAVLEGHTNRVASVAFSPDGTVLVSGSWDRTIRVWDVASKEAVAVLEGRGGLIDAVSFSPDGAILASDDVRGNGAVSLWDTAVWQRIATLEAPGHRTVHHVTFSPGGRVLAVSTRFGRLNLFDVVSGERIETLQNPGAVTYSAFSPDGRLLAVPSSLNRIELWDTSSFTSRRSGIPDWDGDGEVGFFDFVKFAQKFGFSRGRAGYDPRYDLDGDGEVGFSDFLILAGAFGQSG